MSTLNVNSIASLTGSFGFRNRLINAQGLINQRGYVSGTNTSGANEYTVDRWKVVTSGQNLAFTTSENSTTFTAPAGGVEQVIEGLNLETGTYVLSWTGTATATVGGSSVANGGTVSVTGGTNTTVRFSGGTFSQPQFERGNVPTTFERRPIGTELALCQRYYYRINPRAAGNDYAVGYNATTTATRTAVFFPVSMRVAPEALEQSGTASDYSIRHANTLNNCSSVPTYYTSSTDSAFVVLTVTAVLTAGQGSSLRPATTNGYLAWSAEL